MEGCVQSGRSLSTVPTTTTTAAQGGDGGEGGGAIWWEAYAPTEDNTLHWAANRVTDAEFMAFLGRVESGVGFVWGLHPVVEEEGGDGRIKKEVRQQIADLKAFFLQLRRCMGRRAELDEYSGDLYLCSARERKHVTQAMLERSGLELPDGVWPPSCPRIEGRVHYDSYGGEIMYRDKAFLFSNFGNRFDVCLDELVGSKDLPHVPYYLRLCRFRSVEFIIQALSKLVNAQVYPARIRTEDERRRFNEDCERLGLAADKVPRLTPETSDAEADRAVATFNQALMVRVCLGQYTESDKLVKQMGRSVRISPEYFALASGKEFPETIAEGFGLNARIQALGFLLRMHFDPEFKDLCLTFLNNEVFVGEAAAYEVKGNGGGDGDGEERIELDVHWAGDVGYCYAPHQSAGLLWKGGQVFWHDAMGIGYLAAQAVLSSCELHLNESPLNEFVRLIGEPRTIMEAVRMLLKSVLLDRRVE